MDIKNNKEKELVWIQILYLYIVPVLLLYFKVIPGDLRIVMLFGIAILLFGIVRHAKWTKEDFGVTSNFMKDFAPYLLFTIAGVFFLLWLSKISPHKPFLNWWTNIKFLLLFIPISILQEVVFRGILMNMQKRAFKNAYTIILINASVFALIHVIYLNATFVLPMTFMAGVGFAWMYYKYPNLILISISHTVLNFVGMILGFFTLR